MSGITLKCGCIPDNSGYGYCSECVRKLREKIWSNLSDKEKAYDRHFASEQSKHLDDSLNNYERQTSCSCHINPPCSFCTNKEEEDSI